MREKVSVGGWVYVFVCGVGWPCGRLVVSNAPPNPQPPHTHPQSSTHPSTYLRLLVLLLALLVPPKLLVLVVVLLLFPGLGLLLLG